MCIPPLLRKGSLRLCSPWMVGYARALIQQKLNDINGDDDDDAFLYEKKHGNLMLMKRWPVGQPLF